MKVKNTTVANLSVGSTKTQGKAAKKYMVIVAESTLELEDALWLEEYAKPAAHLVESGALVIVQAPALTKEQEDALEAEELAKAEALLAKVAAKKVKVTK